jgi:nucleoid DNA-binding protein
MDRQAKTLVTGDIIRNLRTHGLSRRQAVRIFNAILNEMKAALKRGEEVEWPFGSLKTVRHPRKPKRGWHIRKITTLYKRQFTVSLVRAKEFKDPRIEEQEQKREETTGPSIQDRGIAKGYSGTHEIKRECESYINVPQKSVDPTS